MAPMGPATHPCAIISLIAGIVTCIPGAGIAAIICGFIARGAITREPQRYTGAGMALAGIILGCLHILLGILYLVFVVMLGIIGAASH
jgi:membrane protease YdiL (CAAX protease family)